MGHREGQGRSGLQVTPPCPTLCTHWDADSCPLGARTLGFPKPSLAMCR